MKWRKLKQRIERMTEEQLDTDVKVYSSRYARVWDAVSTVNLDQVQEDSDEIAVVVEQ